MQGGWQPPPGGGGYGAPPGGGGYGQPPPGGPPGYGAPPPSMGFQQNPYGAPPGGQMGGAQYGSYEFNDQENAIIEKAAGRAKLWGIISIVYGVLESLSSCGGFADPRYFTNIATGIVAIVVGISFLGVGNSLRQVVQTQGNDSMHMMQALQKMGGAFMIQTIATIAGFVLYLAIAAIVAVFVVAVAASQ